MLTTKSNVGDDRRLNIGNIELLANYSKLAKTQCNFTTAIAALQEAKFACPFPVLIGVERRGVDVGENIVNHEDGTTTLFVEGTRNLVVWNTENENEYYKCFYDMSMNETTTTTYSNDDNKTEVRKDVVEMGDDVITFFRTDILSNVVENVVTAPGLYQMINGVLGWSTNVTTGVSNVSMIDGTWINVCEELGGGGGGGEVDGSSVSNENGVDGSSSSTHQGATMEGDDNEEQMVEAPVDQNIPQQDSGGVSTPTVSTTDAIQPPSSGFANVQAPWHSVMVVFMVLYLSMRYQ
jgi:hypothetical protein